MSGRAAELAIRLSEQGGAAVAGELDKVGTAARSMGDKVEAAGRSAEKGAAGLDRTAEGADEVASKGAQAAGALSGLGDLIGGPFGGAMQVGGIGLQAMADSGDLLNAALENSVVSTLRAKSATAAKAVVDKASAAATKALTIAQRALNLAQRASPIGLIITGLVLLGGLLVLAYKRSATFRAIVDKAMSVAKAGVDKVVGAFKALGPIVGKVMAFIGKVVGIYVGVYVKAFQLSLAAVRKVWDLIRSAAGAAAQWIGDKIKGLRDTLGAVWDGIRDKGMAAFDALKAPVQAIIDLVQHLLDKISSIHIPHPDLNPFNRATGSSSSSSSSSSVTIGPVTVQVGAGATQAQAQLAAQQMMDAMDARLRLVGRKPVFARS